MLFFKERSYSNSYRKEHKKFRIFTKACWLRLLSPRYTRKSLVGWFYFEQNRNVKVTEVSLNDKVLRESQVFQMSFQGKLPNLLLLLQHVILEFFIVSENKTSNIQILTFVFSIYQKFCFLPWFHVRKLECFETQVPIDYLCSFTLK